MVATVQPVAVVVVAACGWWLARMADGRFVEAVSGLPQWLPATPLSAK